MAFAEAYDLQQQLFRSSDSDHLLLLEHDHVFTAGTRADLNNLLVEPAALGAPLVDADRGGDLTYHGPGQLVGYPIMSVPGKRGGGMADTVAYVRQVEQILIDVVTELGISNCGRLKGYPGVWIDPDKKPRKIAAIGLRLSRGRSMHGFALNVSTDLQWFEKIVPCGISNYPVTSLAEEGIDVDMETVVETLVNRAVKTWGLKGYDRADVVWRHTPDDLSKFSRGEGAGDSISRQTSEATATNQELSPVFANKGTTKHRKNRLEQAGVVGGLQISSRKPSWMKVKLDLNSGYKVLKNTMRELELVTVCEEAGCPNIYECWGQGTATFMINGERCTRACGFCMVDTRLPMPIDIEEPLRIAEAVRRMDLKHVVITAVARDDLSDGGASGFVDTIKAIRKEVSTTRIEVLIPDFKGLKGPLEEVLEAKPDILNHNLETIARLQRAVRPSAGYGRSLAMLARAKRAGFTTKSGLIVGMGETDAEVDSALADLADIGVDIVTIGQYLRPTTHHIPIQRWVEPSTFTSWIKNGTELGIGHVQASPLTRSSYHASQAAQGLGDSDKPTVDAQYTQL